MYEWIEYFSWRVDRWIGGQMHWLVDGWRDEKTRLDTWPHTHAHTHTHTHGIQTQTHQRIRYMLQAWGWTMEKAMARVEDSDAKNMVRVRASEGVRKFASRVINVDGNKGK